MFGGRIFGWTEVLTKNKNLNKTKLQASEETNKQTTLMRVSGTSVPLFGSTETQWELLDKELNLTDQVNHTCKIPVSETARD